jgi:spore coat-associated protein N
MDQTALAHARPRRRRRRFAVLLVLALVSGSLGAGALSLAIFTDSQAVTGNAFATGSIDISTTPATALFNVSNMMPGDTTTQSLVVNNLGTGQLRYAMATSVVSGPSLAGQLQLTVKTLGTSCAAFDGTSVVAAGALSAAAIGSNTQGAQAGDRTLNGLTNETLCFRASLPLSTGNTFQSNSTSVTFTFDAEQVANNP